MNTDHKQEPGWFDTDEATEWLEKTIDNIRTMTVDERLQYQLEWVRKDMLLRKKEHGERIEEMQHILDQFQQTPGKDIFKEGLQTCLNEIKTEHAKQDLDASAIEKEKERISYWFSEMNRIMETDADVLYRKPRMVDISIYYFGGMRIEVSVPWDEKWRNARVRATGFDMEVFTHDGKDTLFEHSCEPSLLIETWWIYDSYTNGLGRGMYRGNNDNPILKIEASIREIKERLKVLQEVGSTQDARMREDSQRLVELIQLRKSMLGPLDILQVY